MVLNITPAHKLYCSILGCHKFLSASCLLIANYQATDIGVDVPVGKMFPICSSWTIICIHSQRGGGGPNLGGIGPEVKTIYPGSKTMTRWRKAFTLLLSTLLIFAQSLRLLNKLFTTF